MWKITEKYLESCTEARAKEVVINVMKALDAYSSDRASLKSLIKDYIYSGFRGIKNEVKGFNEGLSVVFNSKE